ncbi:MAG: 4-deoxy-4-formamido-L-arabinose-phosphoundecaprenol deformylase [Thermodesulfatator sp.]|nr:MAG: 4-deoxy-4-formamido-L-arabinose-phosphoundecaprenol deformylase [Thermodesulfatator sp.]
MLKKKVCLKIDVDTHDGMRDGVPALLEDLEAFDARATFCLSFGPDNAGKAIFRLFKDPGFLKKMLSTGAPKMYGLRTVLSGTLLPARPIASAFPVICKEIVKNGHEAIVHAWDHRKWQDHLKHMKKSEVRQEFEKSFQAFMDVFSAKPRAVAAPGWQATKVSLAVQDELNLHYASDLREPFPCFLRIGQRRFSTLQIPTTGPCIEELLTVGIRNEDEISSHLLSALKKAKQPVLAVHAEVEGGVFRPFFRRFMKILSQEFAGFTTLEEIASQTLSAKADIPVLEFVEVRLPGRAGKVSSAKTGP